MVFVVVESPVAPARWGRAQEGGWGEQSHGWVLPSLARCCPAQLQQHHGVSIFEGQVGFVVAPLKAEFVMERAQLHMWGQESVLGPISAPPHPCIDGDLSPLGLKVNLQL